MKSKEFKALRSALEQGGFTVKEKWKTVDGYKQCEYVFQNEKVLFSIRYRRGTYGTPQVLNPNTLSEEI